MLPFTRCLGGRRSRSRCRSGGGSLRESRVVARSGLLPKEENHTHIGCGFLASGL